MGDSFRSAGDTFTLIILVMISAVFGKVICPGRAYRFSTVSRRFSERTSDCTNAGLQQGVSHETTWAKDFGVYDDRVKSAYPA
jgi:hypothetical protein